MLEPTNAANRSALGLTAAEHYALADLMSSSNKEREGDGPWERSWHQAYDSATGRAYASLARKELVEVKPGRPSAKIAPQYRWRREL